ncbi:MAG: DoxX family membrane protein [Myxococcales bacterium]|nr:DoxX family membrane protein [Myxococcales bacterium]USN51327.1 MAG: DoxX family membrane protein [Myxococcales bacterium]
MSESLFKYARIIYGIPLAITGLIYIINPQGTVESLTSFIPGGLNLIYFFGTVWLVLGSMIALGFYTRYAAWGIIFLISAYIMMIYVPALTEGEHQSIVLFEFLRDLSLMSGAFYILGIHAQWRKEARTKLLTYKIIEG